MMTFAITKKKKNPQNQANKFDIMYKYDIKNNWEKFVSLKECAKKYRFCLIFMVNSHAIDTFKRLKLFQNIYKVKKS